MAQTRAYFLNELKEFGFELHIPKGDVFNYLQCEFFKKGDKYAVAIRPSGSAIEVSVYDLETKMTKKFGTYSEAWNYINNQLKLDKIKPITPPGTEDAATKAPRVKRKVSRKG